MNTIGELFIKLGITGAEKPLSILGSIGKSLGDIKVDALAAKVAIVGAIFAFERLTTSAANKGLDLQQFALLTGAQSKTLQFWQNVGRDAGVAENEITTAVKGIQTAMAKISLGEGPPKFLNLLGQYTGGLDLDKAHKDPFYLLSKAVTLAKNKQVPTGILNEILKGLNLPENLIAGFRRKSFDLSKIGTGQILSDKEVDKLAQARIEWDKFGYSVQLSLQKFTALRGLSIIQDIEKIAKEVLKLSENLVILADKLGVFKGLADAFSGIANSLKLVNEIVDKFSGKESKKGDLLYTAPGEEALPGWNEFKKNMSDLISPSTPGGAQNANNQNINVNQTNNFNHSGVDPSKTSESHKRATIDAYRSMSAQAQGA